MSGQVKTGRWGRAAHRPVTASGTAKIWILLAVAVVATGRSSMATDLLFEDVTSQTGLVYESFYGDPGVAVGDFNGGGVLDLFFCGSPTMGVRMYQGSPDGTYTDVTTTVLPADVPNAGQAIFADVENDGDLDLMLARWYIFPFDIGFDLLINEGGIFIDSGLSADLGRDFSTLGGMTAGDIDLDGDLDVILAHSYGPGFCLTNDGNGGFADTTDVFGANLSEEMRYWAVVLADFNQSGLPDLHAAIDYGHDYHAHNLGGGAFADVSELVGVSNIGADMGVAVGDIENDGDLDIYSTNIGFNCLYVNDGEGNFTNEAGARGVLTWGSISTAWGAAFADFDNDMDEDLAMAATGVGAYFENDGAGYFTLISSAESPVPQGEALITFDWDGDGALDVLSMTTTGAPLLLQNVSPGLQDRHWLRVVLRGVEANSAGVGSRVQAKIGDVTMTREVMASYSFNAGTMQDAHFGTRHYESVDELTVTWPNGRVSQLFNVEVDQVIAVSEALSMPLPLATCVSGPADATVASCLPLDADGDGKVDLADVAAALNGVSLR